MRNVRGLVGSGLVYLGFLGVCGAALVASYNSQRVESQNNETIVQESETVVREPYSTGRELLVAGGFTLLAASGLALRLSESRTRSRDLRD